MKNPNGDPKSETQHVKNLQKIDLMAQYGDRLEDAIADAQYMMIYAATNCPNEIGKDITKKLIESRQIFENNGKLSADQEVEFWENYQRLWRLVQPTTGKDFIITAESIKANMPLKKTFFGWLFGLVPAFSRWTEDWTISKAHRTVNRYIIFTGLVLFVLLILQIYWVVGNRLFVQINDLIKAEDALRVRANENPEIDLKKEFDSLESQLVQTSILFLNWSSPWKQLTENGGFGLGSELDSQLSDIDNRIAEIDSQLASDPKGMEAAKASEAGLEAQSKVALKESDVRAKIDEKLKLVKKKGAIEMLLDALSEKELGIQSKRQALINEQSSLEQDLISLEGEKNVFQSALKDQKADLILNQNNITQKLAAFAPTATPTETPLATETPTGTEAVSVTEEPPATDIAENEKLQLEAQQKTIETQIKFIDNLSSSNPDFNSPAVSENMALAAQVNGLESILIKQSDINGRLEVIKTQLASVDPSTIDDLLKLESQLKNTETEANELQDSINTLIDPTLTVEKQLTGLSAAKDLLQAQSNALQVQIDGIEIPPQESDDLTKELKIVAAKIVADLNQEKQKKVEERKKLYRQAQVENIQEDSRPAQIAAQFVLDILQEYLLPLLYGILGASIYVLRSLSRHISNVTYSDVSGIRHVVHIALGALAGILVGWFSFLIKGDGMFGSVSPLAIAFLVGYNIELVFTKMDEFVVTKLRDIRQRTSLTPEEESQTEIPPGTLAGEPVQQPSSGSAPVSQGPAAK